MVKICEASECEDEDDDGAGIGKPDLARVQNYRIDDLPEEINKSRKGWLGPYVGKSGCLESTKAIFWRQPSISAKNFQKPAIGNWGFRMLICHI